MDNIINAQLLVAINSEVAYTCFIKINKATFLKLVMADNLSQKLIDLNLAPKFTERYKNEKIKIIKI